MMRPVASYSLTTDPGGATVNLTLPIDGPRRALTVSFTRASNTDGCVVQATSDALSGSPSWVSLGTTTGLSGTAIYPWRGTAMRLQFGNTPGEVTINVVAA